jgi:tRNA(Ile)-lysidine synthase
MFAPPSLIPFFQAQPARAYLIAFSGGLDSHVLLHACSQLRTVLPSLNLRVIHIEHGLQAISAQWVQHCQTVCAVLNMPLQIEYLNLTIAAGQSLEAVAREARYAAFAKHLQAGEILLTAHHQNDQAETVLLHLMRGSGIDGLAAMPMIRPFAQGLLARPLLNIARADLQRYAEQYQLAYIEDPSNADNRFERNFIRNQVMPLLKQRWMSSEKTLARVAELQAENRELLQLLVAEKLVSMQGSKSDTLSVKALLAQPLALRKALIRLWLQRLGWQAPEAKQLNIILQEVLPAKSDALPCVRLKAYEVRRYRDDLYALAPLTPHNASQLLHWQALEQPLWIESLQQAVSPQVLKCWLPLIQQTQACVTVQFRQGGEQVLIPYRGGKRSLKQLLQDAAIPPWQRARLPCVYIDKRLVAIIGLVELAP